MTPDATDMSTPVTRGELKEEFAHFEQKLDAKFTQWLETWGGAILARMESSEQRLIERIESGEQRLIERIERVNLDTEQRLKQHIESSEQRLHAELARHTKAAGESMTAQIAVIDEKYADLPARVHQLESNVFPLKRR